MSISTTRIDTGHYEAVIEHDHYGEINFTIKKDRWSGYWDLYETANGPNHGKAFHRKRDAVEHLAKRFEKEKPKKQSVLTEFVSNWPINKANGWAKNHCVPNAIARALADDPNDAESVAAWSEMVADEIRSDSNVPGTLDHKGTYWGNVWSLAEYFGFTEHMHCSDSFGSETYSHNRNKRFPTVTQWLKDNPDVTECIMRTTRHAGYYCDGVGYSLKPRMRVDHVIVINRK